MTVSEEFARVGAEQYVSLTTFRKTGVGVATAVWIAADGDALVVTTGGASGKAKRIRNNAHIELRPCDRAGKVPDGALPVAGVAEIVDDEDRIAELSKPIGKKYGVQYSAFRAAQAVTKRIRRGTPHQTVILRITEPTATPGE